jgi:dipeptidyl aminopeptidase/acylaminoacyl peptidase
MRAQWTAFFALVLLVVPAEGALGQGREPLPLEVAASLSSHNSRSSFDLSPDGEWLAHTVERSERLPSGGRNFSGTGVPFGEGDARMQATLTHTSTGAVVRLGGATGASWAPVWSPDGSKVAFYADDDGTAGVWIWEKAAGKARRFPGVVARPFFGFEVLRWSADGRWLLGKILPAGMTVAQANDLVPKSEEGRTFPARSAGEASVLVFKAEPRAPGDTGAVAPRVEAAEFSNRSMADLALLEVATGRVTRIAERIKPLWYGFSPDQRYVAFTDLQGFAPNTQQPGYRIGLYDRTTRQATTLVANAYLGYGIEINWAPDSRRLAYIGGGQLGRGAVNLVSIPDGAVRNLGSDQIPSFDPGDGELPPLWSAAGDAVYAVGDGKLWRVDVATGAGRLIADIPNQTIRAVVTRPELPTLWTTDDGRSAWVAAREIAGDRSGLFRVDLATGKAEAVVQETKNYSWVFNLDASDVTGGVAFVATDQQHLHDAWLLDTRTGRTRQVSRLNPSLDQIALGTARVISYHGLDGRPLRSALLLPPGYREGERLPMVVWVYGGSMGSQYVNRFGFWGSLPVFNMHILATRGYAVLFPDTPLGPGTPSKDLYDTVLPAVNAAIEQGYADPERLAVSGQSYGSYSSLALITQTKRFKAAIITAAVLHPDLFSAYLEMSPDGMARSTGYYEQGQGNMGGTIWEQRDRYFENSPLFRFDRIETPLLIGQGENDGRLVPSDAMFVALRRLGKAVEYRIYQGEDHVLTRRANVLDFWRRRLDFLAEHLRLTRDARGWVTSAPADSASSQR